MKTVQDKRIFSLIDFNDDYYAILNVDPKDLIDETTIEDRKRSIGENLDDMTMKARKHNRHVLEKAFHEQVKKNHPDLFRGNERKLKEDLFKKIVFAHQVLSDHEFRKFYDTHGEYRIEDPIFQIDDSKVGIFRHNSFENEVGSTIFLTALRCIPGSIIKNVPSVEGAHNYIWEMTVEGLNFPLTVSIVRDPEDMLKLISGKRKDNILPFKVYIFVPFSKLVVKKSQDKQYTGKLGNVEILQGTITSIQMQDHDLYEGVVLEDTIDYITGGKLMKKIQELVAKDSMGDLFGGYQK